MERLTSFVLGHRWVVVLVWVAVAVAGGATATTTVDRLSYEFALPGQPAYEANQQLLQRLGNGGDTAPLVVVARGADAAATADRLAASAGTAVPGTRTVGPSQADALAGDGVAAAVLYPPVTPGAEPYAASQPRLEAVVAQARQQGADVRLTGFDTLTEGSGGDRSVLVEVVLGGLGALVVLALVFGSLLAGVPLLVAAVSILGTYLALLGLTALTDVSFVVQYLTALIGLGVAIDYSLLVVTRWREERDAGADDVTAVRTAMATAGRSVLFSGVTVAVSLAALVLVPLPFLRSIGLGGLLIPLFSVATALTLLPVLLAAAGPRLLWPRRRAARGRSEGSPVWRRVALAVLRHRWVTIGATIAGLLVLAAPVVTLSLGSPQLSGLSSDSAASRAATAAVDGGVPVGVLRPTELLVPAGAATTLAQQAADLDGVAAAVTPPAWVAGSRAVVDVWTADDPADDAGRATLDRIRALADRSTADGTTVLVGGTPAEDADFVTAVYGDAVWIGLAVVVLTFLLLARALRSLWLPVKALVLNVVSISAAYGVTVLIWQDGWGSELLFGQPATGVVTTWVPIAAFAFLFGLSMDYEVFILSRMREAHDQGHDTDGAAVEGIAHTGRLVTSAALILFLAFIALSTVPSVEVKVLATTLALGIALDALVVRALLAPALVGVLGRANWSMPRWLRVAVRA